VTNCNLLLQHAASVVKHQQLDDITALFYVVNVSNVLQHFLGAFNELTDTCKIMQFISNMHLSYSIPCLLYMYLQELGIRISRWQINSLGWLHNK